MSLSCTVSEILPHLQYKWLPGTLTNPSVSMTSLKLWTMCAFEFMCKHNHRLIVNKCYTSWGIRVSKCNKYVCLRGRSYADPTCGPYTRPLHGCPVLICVLGSHGVGDTGNSNPILCFWESNIPQNGRFPALDADELQCTIWRCQLYPQRRNP